MAFVPNCGAIVASHRRRMRELEEDKEQQLLLFNKGVNFKMSNIHSLKNLKFDAFEIEDNWLTLGENITKEIHKRYKSSPYSTRKVMDIQITPYIVEHKQVKKWKVFVKYMEE